LEEDPAVSIMERGRGLANVSSGSILEQLERSLEGDPEYAMFTVPKEDLGRLLRGKRFLSIETFRSEGTEGS
jgi:hypothetical protein